IDLRKHPEEAKKMIGFLPQTAPLLLDLTVDEYLIHCAYMRTVPKNKIAEAVKEVKERCGLTHFSNRLISNLSGGYRQRVGIAQAIIHKPMLVILDEPTNGLDPNQILEVRKLIKEIGRDSLVFFSSHILSEIQATCKHVMMIENGVLVFSDTIDAFENYMAPSSVLVSMENLPVHDVLLAIPGITGVEAINNKRARLRFSSSQNVTEKVIAHSMENGWRLTEIFLEKNSGDEIFARLSKGNKH
ncbi:MAG: ATP-binding cassette domain-containing protein, partial [Chitinophagaceae bacterium]|nr:ATP-binding cassette domain-containing protein [Chitinophagaceae bacterium]